MARKPKRKLPFQLVKRRLVLLFPGFEPLGAEAHRGRFAHAAEKTGPHYATRFACGPLCDRPSGLPGFAVEAQGAAWRTETDVAIFDWSAILSHYADRPVLSRIRAGLAALLSLVANGSFARYVRLSWRYGLFFFYPFFMLAACGLAGLGAGRLIASMTGSTLSAWAGGAAACLSLVMLAAEKAHLLLMMDDWAFAADLAKSANPAVEDQRRQFQTRLAAEVAASDHDEILVVGHSLGCVFAVDALSCADVGAKRQIHMMTAGSSLMKIALQPSGAWLKAAVARLTAARIPWLEVQSLSDVISFFRSNPATSLGIVRGRMPLRMTIRFKHMLSAADYRRGRLNFFRNHRQFMLAPGKPYAYSLHVMACGPLPFAEMFTDWGIPFHAGLFGTTRGTIT